MKSIISLLIIFVAANCVNQVRSTNNNNRGNTVLKQNVAETNDNDDKTELQHYLKNEGISEDTIQKLTNNGLFTIDQLKAMNDYFDAAVDECNINNVIQKIQLKAIINKLSQAVVDKDEITAILEMDNKIKTMTDTMKIIQNTTQKIDEEIVKHTQLIEATFNETIELLNQRKTKLLAKLNQIATDKKNKLQNISSTINQHCTISKQKVSICREMIKKSIQFNEMEERKKNILKIAKEINDIEVVQQNDFVVNDHVINVHFIKKGLYELIRSFGDIYYEAIPILISLDGYNNSLNVDVEWKLNDYQNGFVHKSNSNKLLIEWTSKRDLDGIQHDLKWEYWMEMDLKNVIHKNVLISVVNKNAFYLVRAQYFNGIKWTQKSNAKSIEIHQIETDSFDPVYIGNNLEMVGSSSIVHTGNDRGYRSACLRIVASEGIHIWTFKLEQYKLEYSLIGIWKTKFEPILNTHFTGGARDGNKSYSYQLNSGQKRIGISVNAAFKYGIPCKENDIIEMKLNFNDSSLSYKINGNDYGKAFDIENTEYRAAVTMYWKDNKFTLLSYIYQS
eukprot:442942_1